MSEHAIQTRRWTREEYDRLVAAGLFQPEERLELVEGEIVRMTPQGSAHATSVSLIADVLRRVFGHGYTVRTQMPLALSPVSEPEPDVAVVIGEPRDHREAHPSTAVLVVEVSDTTLGYDRERKATVYASAGIAEYWIVNLAERCLEVHRAPVPIGAQDAHYQSRQVLSLSEATAPLARPEISIPVTDLLP